MGWTVQMVIALEFIHGKDMLHRDIKPSKSVGGEERGRLEFNVWELLLELLLKIANKNTKIMPVSIFSNISKFSPCTMPLFSFLSSILLFEDGRVLKLCDFGTARKLETTLTNAVGTSWYMAPEVIRGEAC